jgi:RTX calcium-binding nonapeptide repeat (4 copies)
MLALLAAMIAQTTTSLSPLLADPACTVTLTNGADVWEDTTPSSDEICGRNGNDVIYAGAADDTVLGENGDDRLFGGEDDDVVTGGNGADRVVGRLGSDRLNGSIGDDTLVANDMRGADTLDGGSGTDSCRVDALDTWTSCEVVILSS